MNKKRYPLAVRRLACYLYTIGIHADMGNITNRKRYRLLLSAYSTLPKEVRREARRRGRQIIRKVGLIEATQRAYPTWAIAPTIRLTRAERAEQMAELMLQSLGRCPHCSTWGKAKRTWPSRELADSFRPFAGDMSLHSYECPVVSGSYHLGHKNEVPPSPS